MLAEKLPCPTFVKLDTEGVEIDILPMAGNLLKNKNEKSICELHPFAGDAFNVNYEIFTKILSQYDRHLTTLDNRKNKSVLPFYGTVFF